MNHLKEEELIAYRENEVKNYQELEQHLKNCPECRAALERIEAVFAAMDAMPVPDPGDDYGRRVWQQIAHRLPEKRSDWWFGFFAPRRLVAFSAVAALVIVAFLAGRWIRVAPPAGSGPTPSVEQVEEAKTRERVLWLAVGEHLGRSEMMLVELANTEPKVVGAKNVDISSEQRRAEDLLDENRLYRQTALQQGDKALVGVLDELERVLLDVAHSPDAISPARLHSIQHRIDSQGILFKVRVVKQQLRERREANPVPSRSTSQIQERNKA